MRILIALAGAATLGACAVTPETVPAGRYDSEAGFAVTLEQDWSRWPEAINPATHGEYLTQDGVLLNRLHLVTLKDGATLVRTARGDTAPQYNASGSELEIVDFVTASLDDVGYNAVMAEDIRPATIDGEDGLRFALAGKWENGLDVRGDAAAVARAGQLHLIFFLAPALHYYGALSEDVDAIIASVDLPE